MKLLMFVLMFYGPLFVRNQSTEMQSLEELHVRIDELEEQAERLMRVSPVWRIQINGKSRYKGKCVKVERIILIKLPNRGMSHVFGQERPMELLSSEHSLLLRL